MDHQLDESLPSNNDGHMVDINNNNIISIPMPLEIRNENSSIPEHDLNPTREQQQHSDPNNNNNNVNTTSDTNSDSSNSSSTTININRSLNSCPTNRCSNGNSDSSNFSLTSSPSSSSSTTSQPPPPPSRIMDHLQSFTNQDLFFDVNTFKQVKRLYCGMLIVAMAYSITMMIMMIVLYKSLPESHSFNSSPFSSTSTSTSLVGEHTPSASSVHPSPSTIGVVATNLPFANIPANNPAASSPAEQLFINEDSLKYQQAVATFYQRFHHQAHSARTQLDQVIAINFLTSILYLMAFYAAQREFYNLTLAFTTTLAVSMIISLVKILTEGTHFPNNLMSLLLRMSIVFVAFIYSSQIRRKQLFLMNANTFWVNVDSQGHSTARSSASPTVHLLNGLLLSGSGVRTAGSDSVRNVNNKTDESMIHSYQDLPPDYEEALRCPLPYVQPVPSVLRQQPTYPISHNHDHNHFQENPPNNNGNSDSLSSSRSSLPPSFEQLEKDSLTNSSAVTIAIDASTSSSIKVE